MLFVHSFDSVLALISLAADRFNVILLSSLGLFFPKTILYIMQHIYNRSSWPTIKLRLIYIIKRVFGVPVKKKKDSIWS